jgi:class 3 adenylate cyclase
MRPLDRTREVFSQLVAKSCGTPSGVRNWRLSFSKPFRDRCHLVLDMCGFSRTTRAHGIIAFLVMIHEMQELCEPIARSSGGILVKVEADNLVFLFDAVGDAVTAAHRIQVACIDANRSRPADRSLHASIGIGFGETLYIGEEDVHGDQMNLACKLGEDIAGPGEILLTESAFEALPPDAGNCRRRERQHLGPHAELFPARGLRTRPCG